MLISPTFFYRLAKRLALMAALLTGLAKGTAAEVDFNRDIRPILSENCFQCHGPDAAKRKAGLRLDTREGATQLNDGAAAIDPANLAKSELLARITTTDPDTQMPPPESNSKLTPEQVQLLQRWVAEGAKYDQHWAFKPPVRHSLPTLTGAQRSWAQNAVDHFVAAKQAEVGLTPSPEAGRATLLRRVSLDLTGLPPTPDQLAAFVADTEPQAYERAVDRLLQSPHYGERWGRHWLDLARYADSDGYLGDTLRNHAWVWRDWAIDAINTDMPFDQFTIEQLAGDLLPNATLVQRVATGFHRAAPFNTEAGTPKEARRTYQVLDRVNVTGTVWLGATLECAQCHDHFYDPISQKEYYQLVAFFNNTPDEMGKSIGAGRAAMAGPTVKVGEASTFVMQEMQKKRTTQIFLRGNYETKGEKVLPKVPGFLHPPEQEAPDNRLGLAQWLVDPANPLTPRVTVNRWWTEIFGTGLVRTGADFGTQGEAPSHPDLLDWLAVDFVEQNWSMKKLLKQIVLSSTYAQSPRISPDNKTKDPQNLLLGRFPKLRLSAEAIRDNALRTGGLLTPALGGPPAYPPQPEGIWWIRDDKSPRYVTSTGEERYRRSLYTIWRRTYLHPTLSNFDAPNRVTCSADRERTNTPLQALTLMNDPIFLEAGFGLARRMFDRSKSNSIKDAIRFGFCLSTTRDPDQKETDALRGLHEKSLRKFSKDGDSAYKLLNSVRGELALGVSPLNASEVALLAAWFQVANVLLNLDETISKG